MKRRMLDNDVHHVKVKRSYPPVGDRNRSTYSVDGLLRSIRQRRSSVSVLYVSKAFPWTHSLMILHSTVLWLSWALIVWGLNVFVA